jgi:hypothetical protein
VRVEDRIDFESLTKKAWQLRGTTDDYDPLLDRIGNSSFALLGEASHGTHEFYRCRAEITKRLIIEIRVRCSGNRGRDDFLPSTCRGVVMGGFDA